MSHKIFLIFFYMFGCVKIKIVNEIEFVLKIVASVEPRIIMYVSTRFQIQLVCQREKRKMVNIEKMQQFFLCLKLVTGIFIYGTLQNKI